jgi:hypothetical protein
MNRKHGRDAQYVAEWLTRQEWQNPANKAAYAIGHFVLGKRPEEPVEFSWEPPSHSIRYGPDGGWALELGHSRLGEQATILYLIERLQNDGGLEGCLSLCPSCNRTWYVSRPNKKFCSDKCRVAQWASEHRAEEVKRAKKYRAKIRREQKEIWKGTRRTVKRGQRNHREE